MKKLVFIMIGLLFVGSSFPGGCFSKKAMEKKAGHSFKRGLPSILCRKAKVADLPEQGENSLYEKKKYKPHKKEYSDANDTDDLMLAAGAISATFFQQMVTS